MKLKLLMLLVAVLLISGCLSLNEDVAMIYKIVPLGEQILQPKINGREMRPLVTMETKHFMDFKYSAATYSVCGNVPASGIPDGYTLRDVQIQLPSKSVQDTVYAPYAAGPLARYWIVGCTATVDDHGNLGCPAVMYVGAPYIRDTLQNLSEFFPFTASPEQDARIYVEAQAPSVEVTIQLSSLPDGWTYAPDIDGAHLSSQLTDTWDFTQPGEYSVEVYDEAGIKQQSMSLEIPITAFVISRTFTIGVRAYGGHGCGGR